VASLEIDGTPLSGNTLPALQTGTHHVKCVMGV
jgi:hypothetical protein